LAVADLADVSALTAACSGVETLFHCAGYAHAFSSLSSSDVTQHWAVNFEGTRNIVNAAGRSGVRRFVFLSSIKAMAEPGDCCVDEQLSGSPLTAYGRSKLAAEEAVLEAGEEYGMHVVNLRLTMVYGRGGRGNLERMGRMVRKGMFPPLPETGNHRSLVHVDDVISAIRLVADDSRAAGKSYIIAGKEAPSGRELFDALRVASGLSRCTWSVPEALLRYTASVLDFLEVVCKRRFPMDTEVLDRLLGSAWYSSALIENELGWQPGVSLSDGLSEMLKK
jgi:nucleoside-diphosphate-sugar epimerase